MMELPKVLAMVICGEVIEDRRTGKKSLIGFQLLLEGDPIIERSLEVTQSQR